MFIAYWRCETNGWMRTTFIDGKRQNTLSECWCDRFAKVNVYAAVATNITVMAHCLCNLRLADNTSSAALSCNSAVATLPWLLLSLSLPWLNVGWLLLIDLFFLAALHHDAINDDAAFIIASFLSIHHFASLRSRSVNLLCCTKAMMLLTCLHQCRRLIVVYFVNFLSFCATGHCSLTLVANPIQALHPMLQKASTMYPIQSLHNIAIAQSVPQPLFRNKSAEVLSLPPPEPHPFDRPEALVA